MKPNTPQKKSDEDEFIARMRRQHGDNWCSSCAASMEDAKESAQNRNDRAKKYQKRGEMYDQIIVSSCKYEGEREYGDDREIYSFRTKTIKSGSREPAAIKPLTKPPRTPAPSVPAILTPAPAATSDMASVPVRLGGGGIPPIPGMGAAAAPKPKQAAKPAKKAAAPKPKSKAKNGKTAAGIVLTAAQKKRLAAKGSITIKRGGKFVTVTR